MALFFIEFNNPDKKYFAGEKIQCNIIITVSTTFKARVLSIQWRGFAHTEWEKRRKDNKNRTYHITVTGDEEYFNFCQYLLGSADSPDNQEILPGTYNYDATFTLPSHLPGIIEHENGHIKYDITLKYEIDSEADKNFSLVSPFYVIPKIDLNEIPNLQDPIKDVKEETFGCWCCESDPMQLVTILPKTGYVPGETIPITIEVDNNSNLRINSVRVQLYELMTFYVKNPSTYEKQENNIVYEHIFETKVEPYQNKLFKTDFYLDPTYSFTIFDGCELFKCEYQLKTEALVPRWHFNPFNVRTITIGTVPFNDVMSGGNHPTAPIDVDGVVIEQPLPSYNDVALNLSAGSGIGWNIGPKAPLASTEKINWDEDAPPPSFEDIQNDKFSAQNEYESSNVTVPQNPSAPPE